MGSFAVARGTIEVRSCPETEKIVEQLRELTRGMDERTVCREPLAEGAIHVEIDICGHTSASHSSAIDDTIRELAPFAVEAAEFHTEWEGESSHFFVGSDEDVEKAESAHALREIFEHARSLRGDDVEAALREIARKRTGKREKAAASESAGDEPHVHLRIPRQAWKLLGETLERDSRSKAFDPKLRKEIADAVRRVEVVEYPVELVEAAEEALEWAEKTGGWDAPCWRRLREAVRVRRSGQCPGAYRALKRIRDILFLDMDGEREFFNEEKSWNADTLDEVAEVLLMVMPIGPESADGQA